MPSLTMLAQEGAAQEKGSLAGREDVGQFLILDPPYRPACDPCKGGGGGEAGGDSLLSHTQLARCAIYPARGGGGGEEGGRGVR